jgi:hypothetical protein
MVSGAALYAATVTRAIGKRFLAYTTPVLPWPKRMQPALVAKTRVQVIAVLTEHIDVALAELSDINPDELTKDTVEETPEKIDETNE